MKTQFVSIRIIIVISMMINLLAFTAHSVTVKYISPNGSGNGQNMANPMDLSTFLTYLNTASNFNSGHVDTFYFAPGNYNITGDGIKLANNSNIRGTFVFAKTPGLSGDVIFIGNNTRRFFTTTYDGTNNDPVKIFINDFRIVNFNSGSTVTGLINFYCNYYNVTLNNVIIENCESQNSQSGNDASMIVYGWYTSFNMLHCTVRNCNYSHLLYQYPDGVNTLNFAYNSIYDNTFRDYIFEYRSTYTSTKYLIYNNTFSSNSLTGNNDSKRIRLGGENLLFANNTIYNSGALHFYRNHADIKVMNNIVINNTNNNNAIIQSSGDYNNVNMRNNIFSTSSNYATYWNMNTESFAIPLTPVNEFSEVFNTTLDISNSMPGMQVHKLKNLGKIYQLWNIHSGYDISKYASFTDDQQGKKRPKPFAIGAYDEEYMKLRNMPAIYYIYSSPVSMPLADKEIDLGQLFDSRITGVNAFYAAGGYSMTSPVGTLTLPTSGDIAYFTPNDPTLTTVRNFTYKFYVVQGSYTALDSIEIRMFDSSNYGVLKNDLPGYVNPSGYNTCYDFMGAVKFTSAYRFRTGHASSDPNRIAWSTNILVADLNRDGYPELLSLFLGANGSHDSEGHGGWRGVSIYDGRSGSRIARLPFKNNNGTGGEMAFTHYGWHSATPFALIDSDRDGFVELIIAFPHYGSATSGNANDYINRLVSYKLIPSGNTYTMIENPYWTTKPQYNTGNTFLHKPVPQICDFDGDGTPEVLVYNKVYSAKTGKLLLEIENMGTNTTDATAYIGLNRNAPNGESYDKALPFCSVYDITGDGIYDIIAGGKIYKMNRIGNSSFATPTIITPSNGSIDDGYTAIADVDGDGTPDIVVVNTNSSNDIVVTVWNPDPAKGIIATRTIPIDGRTFGSNSYVFVGDIDGRVQRHGGIDYRLPEIAILSGNIRNLSQVPLHPNISGISTADGGIPVSGSTGGTRGCLFSLTFDKTAVSSTNALKLSFILNHNDDSNDTGFTMFDFDNDGINEICYRDNNYLRIIKPTIPFVKEAYTNNPADGANYQPDVILLREDCGSTTGFEYPVIADIDGDNSAEIVVPGCDATGNVFYSFIYVIGNGIGDKFAPALPVWNQYMYDPFKIKIDGDSLVTRLGKAPNRLDTKYNLIREVKDENGKIISVRNDYNPFNGNITQAANIDGSLIPKYEPIVFLTDAGIVQGDAPNPDDRPSIKINSNGDSFIEIKIGNKASAKSSVTASWPITVYNRGSIDNGDRFSFILADIYNDAGTTKLGSNFIIVPGDTVKVRIKLTAQMGGADGVYIVRFADNSDGNVWRFGYNNAGGINSSGAYTGNYMQGLGTASRQYRDCFWNDNVVRVAKPRTFPDFYTVQELGQITMPILSNDILPDVSMPPYFPNGYLNSLILTKSDIVKHPLAGYITFNGQSGVNNRLTYHHVDSINLPLGIDSFQYKLRYINPITGNWDEPVETVYIYVLRGGSSGFTVCSSSSPNTIDLSERPLGINFDWFNNKVIFLGKGLSRLQSSEQKADSTYYVKPDLNNVTVLTGKLKGADFPAATLKVSMIPLTQGSNPLMRWTGAVSNSWRDPNNWEAIKTENGKQYTAYVNYIPAPCTDIIIPASVERYPELVNNEKCHDINIKDRAQLKNPHVMTYNKASVELKLKPDEKDRFVMWSPPLMDTYTGDYHYKLSAGNPVWGDVFMNFFQQQNPEISGTAVINRLTATIGKIDHKLQLGDAFNIKVKSNTVIGSDVFTLPKTAQTYVDANNKPTGTLSRPNLGKFITHNMTFSNGYFKLPVKGGNNTTNRLILVANPYLAYLDISKFLAGNPDLQQNGYYIWNGKSTNDFTAITKTPSWNGDRWEINSTWAGLQQITQPGYILPLQSFFVIKKNANTPFTTVNLHPDFSTTKPPQNTTYTLRTDNQPVNNVLNMRISQGENNQKTAYTAIIYNPTSYPDKLDMPVITYSEMPLSLYTFSNYGEALAINGVDKFSLTAYRMKLGMRIRDAGEVKLSFANISTFCYNVILIDKERRNNTRIDLSKSPEYTFSFIKSTSEYTEINNRFELEFIYKQASGTMNEDINFLPILSVSGKNSVLDIHAINGRITSLQVYDTLGKLIYNNVSLNDCDMQISVPSNQLYLIRAVVAGEIRTKKVIVR